jgi:hypothetical protein
MSGPEPVSFSLDTVSKAALSLVQTLTVNEANTYERHRTSKRTSPLAPGLSPHVEHGEAQR